MAISMTERLAAERRARLAAERLLDLRSRELFNANKKLSHHALQLSGQIVEQRQETEQLKDYHAEAQAQLQVAEEKVVIAERRLWDSVETVTDGFAVFNSRDCLIAANSAWVNLFDPRNVIVSGAHLFEVLRSAARSGHILLDGQTPEEWSDEVAARWSVTPVPEHLLAMADGRYFRLIDRRSRDGDMVCLAQDITAIKQREAQLNEARKSAEAAARAKSAFLANMSHELRTPMNGVVSMAELMLEMDLDPEQELYLNTIRNSGAALLHIINDVLDFSKLEAERMVLHPEPFDLERLMHEILLLVAPTARDKNLSVLLDYDLFLPTRLVGDPGRLRQIMTNLVGNAVKFTQSGHVLIRSVGIETQENVWQLHITIEDTGIGIPDDKLGHIFGSFSQVDDEQNREFEGTGLGLSICEQLVALMGGDIWVESELGVGSCFGFRVELPSGENRRTIKEPIEPDLAQAVVIGGSEVERHVLRGQLTQLGVTTRTFALGSDGMDALRPPPVPQMIFVEERLDDGLGLDLVRQIRELGLTSAIIMLTDHKETLGLREAGANASMTRPVLRSDLFHTLATLSVNDDPQPEPAPPEPIVDLEPLAEDVPPPVQEPEENPPSEDAGPRRLRILAADDNKTNRFVFSKMVKSLDIDLDFATDGAEAVEKFTSFAPDMIFMDISMPRMDGREATAAIRALEAEGTRVPIVALTALAVSGDEEEILSHGLDQYLSKPIKKPILLGLIADYCPATCKDPFPTTDP